MDFMALVPSRITSTGPLRDVNRGGPAYITNGGPASKHYRSLQSKAPLLACVTPITYAFLHADIWHIFFNMWYLAVFRRNIENAAWAHGRFLAFYLAYCGLLAGIAARPWSTRRQAPRSSARQRLAIAGT